MITTTALLRRLALVLALVVVAVAATTVADAHTIPPSDGTVTRNDAALGASYAAPDPASLGGPFTLVDHSGRTVTQASWPGQWLLVTFGFPGCRESCPVTLDHLSKALDLMGREGDILQPLFVDVSMDKTPDLRGLGQFVGNFHERMIGLGGSRAQTFAMLRNFKVRREYAHVSMSTKETGPRINHTTYVYLVDPQGKTRGYFYHDLSPERMVETVRQLMSAPAQ